MVFGKVILPPGYRFQPSDKQIIKDYLVPKVENTLPDVSWFIFKKEIYKYSNPFLLFQEIQRNQGYFFTTIKKVSSSGGRNVNRKTGDGTWKGQKPIILRDDDEKPIGIKRSYNFEFEVAKEKKSEVEREKGHWIMHEYSLLPDYYTNNKIKADPEYVLCVIRTTIPIIDVNAVREQEQISQPVAKRQRTKTPSADTMPPIITNGSSMSWVPSLLPAETTASKFVDLEAAPILDANAVRQEQLQSQPVAKRQRTSMSSPSTDTFMPAVEPTINNGSSTSWVPSPLPVETTPVFNNGYVPLPVPESPTTCMINGEESSEWVPLPPQAETNISDFMGTDLASSFCNSESSEWVPSPAATKTIDTYLPQPECEFLSDLFSVNGESSAAWFPSTPLSSSNAELSEWLPSQQCFVPVPPAPTTMLSEFQPLTGDELVDFFTFDGNDLVPAVEDNPNTSSMSWVPSPLPAETTASNFVDLEAAPVLNNVESSSDWVASLPPVFNNVESLLNNGGELSDASAPVFSNAELSEWFPSQPPATDPYVPVPAPPNMLSDFDEFINDGGWGNLFSFDNNDLPAVQDSLNTTTTPDNNEWDLDDLLPTSEDKLNSGTPRDNSHTYCDSRNVIKASDSEAVKISKLGWDPVAYKACFPNFQPMY